MNIENKLESIGLKLPPYNRAAANYTPTIQSGTLIYTAGQTPRYEGELQFKGPIKDQNIALGKEAAQLCTLNCLSVIKGHIGHLDRIVRIVKITGYVLTEADFTQHAAVLDGATDLLVELFGDQGRPARTSVGVYTLPGNASCEIEMIVEVKGENQ